MLSRNIARRHVLLLLVVLLASAEASMLGADSARAAPGFTRLGSTMGLGLLDEREPTPVLHNGQLYAATVAAIGDRRLLYVRRLVDDAGGRVMFNDVPGKHWEQLGGPLNTSVDQNVTAPSLLSVGGELYVAWVQHDPGVSRGSLMMARLENGSPARSRWSYVELARPVEIRPDSNANQLVRLISLGGRPAAVYIDAATRQPVLVRLTEGGPQTSTIHVPQGLGAPAGVGSDGGALYVVYRQLELATGWNAVFVTLRLDRAGALVPVGRPYVAERTGPLVAIADQPGAPPLVAFAPTPDRFIVARLGPPDSDRLVHIATLDRPGGGRDVPDVRPTITRMPHGIALAAPSPVGVTLYNVPDNPAELPYHADQPVAALRDLHVIAGPDGQPFLTLQERTLAVAYTYTPDGGS